MFTPKTRKTYPLTFKEDVVVRSQYCDRIKELTQDLGLDSHLAETYIERDILKKIMSIFTSRPK